MSRPASQSHIAPTLGSLVTVFTVLVLVGSVAYSIAYAEWMPGLTVALWAVFFGALAGWLLAHSSFPSWTAHLASLIYGLFCVTVIGATQPRIIVIAEWRERVFMIIEAIVAWVRAAVSNGTSNDPLIFVLVICALFWLLSYSAVWYSVRRRRIWHVILPAGVTLFSNVYYYNKERSMAPFFIVYLVCVVVLLALTHLADREESWLRNRVRFTASLRGGFVTTGLAIALIALLFSWRITTTMTSPAARAWFGQFNEPYSELLARWNRMFSTLQNPVARPIDSYPDSFELGGPRNLTDEPVMQVIAPPARYYWRARSHDFYDGRGWKSTIQTEQDLDPNSLQLALTQYRGRTEVAAIFSLSRATNSVWLPSQPVRASVAARALFDGNPNSGADLVQLKLPVALLAGNQYTGRGSLSTAKINELREAGENYPEWTQKYLQTPQLTERTLVLASRLTREQTTPFDKARAVEKWLRTNIKYDDKLEAPPAGQEGSDYILFDTKRAYCDYYATAMVMILRSQGIPARYVQGYAQGIQRLDEIDSETAEYSVIRKDSHSWVEVFFPTYGWVEFEPTSGQPEIPRLEDRPEGAPTPTPDAPTPEPNATSTPLPGQLPTPTPQGAPPQNQSGPSLLDLLRSLLDVLSKSWLRYLLIVPLLIGLAALALRVAEQFGLNSLPVVERTYGMLTRWAGWLGIGRDREHTPFEQARALAGRAPEASDGVQRITELYVARRFAPKVADARPADAERDTDVARALWKGMRTKLGKAWIVTRVYGVVDALSSMFRGGKPAGDGFVDDDGDGETTGSVRALFKVPHPPSLPNMRPNQPHPTLTCSRCSASRKGMKVLKVLDVLKVLKVVAFDTLSTPGA